MPPHLLTCCLYTGWVVNKYLSREGANEWRWSVFGVWQCWGKHSTQDRQRREHTDGSLLTYGALFSMCIRTRAFTSILLAALCEAGCFSCFKDLTTRAQGGKVPCPESLRQLMAVGATATVPTPGPLWPTPVSVWPHQSGPYGYRIGGRPGKNAIPVCNWINTKCRHNWERVSKQNLF